MNFLRRVISASPISQQQSLIHTSCVANKNWFQNSDDGASKWLRHNKTVFPPELDGKAATERLAYVCHAKTNIKYSPKKLWYVASLVRGMTVDEAVKQLSFTLKKGAEHVRNTILEAQKMAVDEHNVEFKSNLWVAESFVGKGRVYKGVRRHARMRTGEIRYMHSHYYVRLEEGTPPADYYGREKTPEQQLDEWVDNMRKRKITHSL